MQEQFAPARTRFALAAVSMVARQQLASMCLARSRLALPTTRSSRAASLRMQFAPPLVRRHLAPLRTLFALLQMALLTILLLQAAPLRLPIRMHFGPARRTERFSVALLRLARTQFVLAQMRPELGRMRFALGQTRSALWGLHLVCTGHCGLAFRLGNQRHSKVPSPGTGRNPTERWLICTEPAQR